MNFSDLQPGDLFTFRPIIGMPWRDQNLYRKATDRTYHRADKMVGIVTVRSAMTPVTPESSDAVAVECLQVLLSGSSEKHSAQG